MVDHRELFEDVTATLAQAGFDTGQGPSGLRIGHRPQGVVVGWTPTEACADGPSGGPDGGEARDGVGVADGAAGPLPAEIVRTAVSGAVAVVLRASGYQVTETGPDGVLVTAGPPPAETPPDARAEAAAVPEQWWG
ncbi:hypothetical protein [Kitasatospora sp. A2-31]|uniref:hypothetical protein n=1 Tax=Kitasatospora sp. A2-31 TaxID=2916414 RepID=UPI001EE9C378|nr:hypothetical protein [Kitasatospora sp. A2-31]MCG6493865.1 hypothetical protein [Kitasatospora sp. A2-31]